MGHKEMQTSHELRQAEQGAEVCVCARCVECQAIALLVSDKSRCLSHRGLHKLFTPVLTESSPTSFFFMLV